MEERGDVYTGFWWGNLREADNLENPNIDGILALVYVIRLA
jgi:hypothetical protein